MLLRSGKRCNPNQSSIKEKLNQLNEKFNLLFREVQSIKLEMQDNNLKYMRTTLTRKQQVTTEPIERIATMRASTCLEMTMMKLSVGLS